jgi:DNA-binding response OmpR family regulator
MNRIVLVEDTNRLAELIHLALSQVGIAVDVFTDLTTAYAGISAAEYAVAVIDRGLPDGDGLDLVRQLRAGGRRLPCLMLTARDAVHDRIEGLESGADDYLPKPFAMAELVARIHALMRRPAQMQTDTPSYGGLDVAPEKSGMQHGKAFVSLAPAELQIMVCLVRAQGSTVRHSVLEHAAWGQEEAVTPNALDVALHRLRKKLSAIGAPVRIVNYRSQGYVLEKTYPQ